MIDVDRIKSELKEAYTRREAKKSEIAEIEKALKDIYSNKIKEYELESEVAKSRTQYINLESLQKIRSDLICELNEITREIESILTGDSCRQIRIHLR